MSGKWNAFIAALAVLACTAQIASAGQLPAEWKKIDVLPGTYHVVDGNGNERDIQPSCSGGPVCAPDPATGQVKCAEGNKQFSFYFKQGAQSKLLVYFDGGGACWNNETCVIGAATPLSAYVAQLGPQSSPEGKGGLFDLNNQDNPYKDWSMVVIPYCTGDIHWGSNDQEYTDYLGATTGVPGSKVTIHHRGFDNFLYVRQWVKHRFGKAYEAESEKATDGLRKLLVTGSSAGAYGAAFAYPHLKQLFPASKGYLMADAGNGVVADQMLMESMDTVNGTWNIGGNLAHWIPGVDALPSTPASSFINTYYFALTGYYPRDRFSQYTTLWDTVQALFYNIMLNENNIPAWGNLTPAVYGSWTAQMVNHVFTSAVSPNYRFYVGEGCNHTVLRFSDDFYKTSPNQPIPFVNWFKALTQDGDDATAWQNSFCQNCNLPPSPAEVYGCLARSFNP